MVPSREVASIGDICFANGVFVSDDGIAYLQVFEMLAEGVILGFVLFSTLLVDTRYTANGSWGALYSCALQVMEHAAFTAHLFAATCTTGATMNQQRHW